VAAEGLVGVAVEANLGVVVEVNSETDFVARNDDFQSLVRGVLAVAIDKGASVDAEAIKGAHFPGGGTVADAIANAIATIGENITLRRAQGLHVAHGAIGHYVHGQIVDGLGRIAVIVAVESTGAHDALAALGRQIAMHVAASSPIAVDAASIDPAIVAREKSVLADKNAGKPPNVLAKIVESGLKTYYKEVCLLDQPFVMDPTKSVAQAVKEAEKTVGAPISVKGFVRYALGEGIEKPVEEG
jgi:elongation factor Ts